MKDAYRGSTAGEERVEVYVLFVEGTGGSARARLATVHDESEKRWVPAAKLAESLGVPVVELPGMRVLAVVSGGELSGFEPVGR